MDNNTFSFSHTETGFNHIKANKVCEDASDFYEEESIKVCVVADGHGSDNYPRTDRGSKYAVQSAISSIVEFVKEADPDQVIADEQNHYSLLLQLSKSILKEWYQLVEEDIKIFPFTDDELEKVSEKYKERYFLGRSDYRPEKAYGSTLIAYAVTDKYSFGLQIGDGQCVVVDRDGSFSRPVPWDDNCQMNVTTSICDSDAIEEFRFYVSEEPPSAVFCGTDGIDDSYAGEEELYAFYRSILKIFIDYGKDMGIKEVKDYLPKLSKQGSGDDVSVAVIIDEKRLYENKEIINIQMQMYKESRELEELKHKFEIKKEKVDALINHIPAYAISGSKPEVISKQLIETGHKIAFLDNERLEIEKRIEELNENIGALSKKIQSILYERDSASFSDNILAVDAAEIDQSMISDDSDSIGLF